MRWMLLILLFGCVNAYAAQKKKSTKSNGEQPWDGNDDDVSWVEDAPSDVPALKKPLPWFTFGVGAGRRIFADDASLVQYGADDQIQSEGHLRDLIKPGAAWEGRVGAYIFGFLGLGVQGRVEEAHLQINNQSVSIAPQELAGYVQFGPRFGPLRLYGYYQHVIKNETKAEVTAPTVVSDTEERQCFTVSVKETGGEAGLGGQLRFGWVAFYIEGSQSINRQLELSVQQDTNTWLRATSKPTFKAWHLGLSLEI